MHSVRINEDENKTAVIALDFRVWIISGSLHF